MNKKYNIYSILIISALLIWNQACIDLPTDIVLPSWDVDVNVPVLNRTYTLLEAVEKDTSSIKWYRDGEDEGLLYYSQANRIEPIVVGDNLEIENVSTSSSVSIGKIEIEDPEPVNTDIEISEWTPFQPGETIVVPPSGNIVSNKSFQVIAQFEEISAEAGEVEIEISNVLPVQMDFHQFNIKNTDGSIVIEHNADISLQPNEVKTIAFDINDTRVTNALTLESIFSTPGSGGNAVTLQQNAGTKITAQLSDLSINNATAKLPEQQSFTLDSSFVFDDSSFISTATFEAGSLELIISNDLDLDLNAVLTISNLLTPGGTSYSQNFILGRKEKNKIIQIPSLNSYKLITLNSSLTNELFYNVVVNAGATNDVRTVDKSEGVLLNIEVGDLIMSSIDGLIKPTELNVEETSIELDLGDLGDKFSMEEINFESPEIQLILNKSADIEIGFSGQMIGKNENQTRSILIPYTILAQEENIIILNKDDVREFIKGFAGKFPETISVTGSGIVNPGYKTGSVSKTDSIYGKAEIEFPFKVGIAGANFRDSTDVDISSNDKKDLNSVRAGSVTFEFQNSVAGNVSFEGKLYDSSNNFLMNFPPERAPNASVINVEGGTVDPDGKVTAPGISKVVISLNKEEIDKFIDSKYLISNLSLYSSGNNNQPVEFRTNDEIKVKVYGSFTYRVKEGDKNEN